MAPKNGAKHGQLCGRGVGVVVGSECGCKCAELDLTKREQDLLEVSTRGSSESSPCLE